MSVESAYHSTNPEIQSLNEQSKKYLEIMEKKCPMSLTVTAELLERGKNKSLKECLEMEYQLSQNMVYRCLLYTSPSPRDRG